MNCESTQAGGGQGVCVAHNMGFTAPVKLLMRDVQLAYVCR